MTEVHASLGLANLKYGDEVLADRKRKYQMYRDALSACDGHTFQNLKFGESNYSYFPVVFDSEERLLEAEKALNAKRIFPRRYFYPSVNTLEHIVECQPMPVSEDIASRILCLPLYWKLEDLDVQRIINTMIGKVDS